MNKNKLITDKHRYQILNIAKLLQLNLNDLEFRQNGIRYKYWNEVGSLANLINENVIPCKLNYYEDNDCGNLYFVEYNNYKDSEFPNSSHNQRYEIKYEKKTLT